MLCDGSYAWCDCVVCERTPVVLATGGFVERLEEEVRANSGGALELLHHATGIVRARRSECRVDVRSRACGVDQFKQALE